MLRTRSQSMFRMVCLENYPKPDWESKWLQINFLFIKYWINQQIIIVYIFMFVSHSQPGPDSLWIRGVYCQQSS